VNTSGGCRLLRIFQASVLLTLASPHPHAVSFRATHHASTQPARGDAPVAPQYQLDGCAVSPRNGYFLTRNIAVDDPSVVAGAAGEQPTARQSHLQHLLWPLRHCISGRSAPYESPGDDREGYWRCGVAAASPTSCIGRNFKAGGVQWPQLPLDFDADGDLLRKTAKIWVLDSRCEWGTRAWLAAAQAAQPLPGQRTPRCYLARVSRETSARRCGDLSPSKSLDVIGEFYLRPRPALFHTPAH